MSSVLGRGPRVSEEQKKRIPPGQYFTEKWPVLHYGSVPRVDLKTWDFKVWGEVDNPFELSWAEFKTLPRILADAGYACGLIQVILERAQLRPSARFVVVHAEQGYTTNLPLSVLDDDDVILADMADGAPLTPDHGYPLRLVVPKRYFWKSAKWARGLQFIQVDKPGFWERYGYNNNADPWKEERFSE